MHQTVLQSIDSVQLFQAAGRGPPEVNLALSEAVGIWNISRLRGVPDWLSSFSETLRQNTSCAGYHGGSAQPWPRPEDPGRCSVLTHDCLPRCHDLYPPDDTLPWMLQAGHNMQGLEWRPSVCTSHTCDIAGKLVAGVHLRWSSCHPTRPGNVKDGWFPEFLHDYRGKSQTLKDVWWYCPL